MTLSNARSLPKMDYSRSIPYRPPESFQMSKILTTHKERLAAYRHMIMAPVNSAEEQVANHKRAQFEYREGLADDIEKILESSGRIKWGIDQPQVRQLATEIARYVTGEQ